jgi:lysophospholipase L1-like esterase
MKSILIFGDSNTWGYVPGGNGQRFDHNDRWPGVLRRELGADYQVIDEGLCGRTTTSDDLTEGDGRNGARMIKPLMLTHSPLDYVIIMLGTNDLKNRFGKSSMDIALGVSVLVKMIRSMPLEFFYKDQEPRIPEILVIVPPPIFETGPFKEYFVGGSEKSKSFSRTFSQIGSQHDFKVLDTAEIIQSSEIDGIHLSKESHLILGKAVAEYIKQDNQ